MPKIYAHFGDKRALCTAVVTRGVLARISQFNSEAPPEGTIEERLARAGIALLHWTLENERMALMRLAVAEAQRLPYLARTVSRTARQLRTEVTAVFGRQRGPRRHRVETFLSHVLWAKRRMCAIVTHRDHSRLQRSAGNAAPNLSDLKFYPGDRLSHTSAECRGLSHRKHA
jgi:AcrR family transcriptional regulator